LREKARDPPAGEFTYRAYVNNKLDLAQAEGVQQLISAGARADLAQAALAECSA
jgi:tRNA U34 5-carboxymethylaminomethyl modifying GTPase MnmE/TrmE